MSFIFKEKETFGFLQEINSRKIEKDNNIYNQLIRFWNNFYASDNIVKVLVMKFDLFYMGVVFVCIFIFSAQIMLLTLGIVILFIIYFIYGRMKRIADNKLLTTKLGKLSVFVEEFIHNRLDRFIFADDNEVDRYCHEILSEIKEIEEKQRKDSSVILTVYDSLMYLNLIAIFAYVVVSFRIVLENSIFSSMIGFLLVYILYGLGKPTVQRALELEKFNTKFPYRKIKKIEQAILGDKKNEISRIIFNDVSFAYEENDSKYILNHFSQTFDRSKLYVIKGKNGVGKTTLLNLIIHLEKATLGRIYFFDRNNEMIDLQAVDVKKIISYYSSNQYLNCTTIENNISYDFYKDSNRSSNVENIFNLDMDKVVFYNGENLSLGERQKILLSRSLNKKSDIYLFDEPTTNMDNVSKQIFLKRLHTLKDNSIILLVSHDDFFDEVADEMIYL